MFVYTVPQLYYSFVNICGVILESVLEKQSLSIEKTMSCDLKLVKELKLKLSRAVLMRK